LETFVVEPPQNFNTSWVSLVTIHLSLECVMDYQVFEYLKGRVTFILRNLSLSVGCAHTAI